MRILLRMGTGECPPESEALVVRLAEAQMFGEDLPEPLSFHLAWDLWSECHSQSL